MPKRKANSTRTPPEPARDHTAIAELLEETMPKVRPLAKRLDEIICETIPDLRFAVKWGKAYYGLPDLGWVIEVTAYHKTVNISFYAGAEFNPPPPLGDTGRSRYVKLGSLEKAEAPEIRSWIEQAATVFGWE